MSDQAAIGICHGPRCGDYGGIDLAKALALEGIRYETLPCQSLCQHGPIARLDGVATLHAKSSDLVEMVKSKGM